MASSPAVFPVRVEVVVLAVLDDTLCVALERRGEQPQKGRWALPGSDVAQDESLPAAADRALAEVVGVTATSGPADETLATRSVGRRDPRAPLVVVTRLAVAAADAVAEVEPPAASWWGVEDILDRPRTAAFDTVSMVTAARERLSLQLATTTVGAGLCPEEFTIAELRRVYELVWGVEVDPRNFHRKMTTTADFLVPTGTTTVRQGGRPARLYRRGSAQRLSPPIAVPAG
ncbi:MAG: NUDIX hydrolase [Actinomycetales bacterium]